MNVILLFVCFVAQGIPTAPGQSGVITGVLRSGGQQSAAGVRVAAMAAPESIAAGADGVVLASITQTDANGAYRLEGIPPGRYLITAGRVDVPTFYPGTLDITKGTMVQITPGAIQTGVDFTLSEISIRLVSSGPVKSFAIPLQVTVEGSGRFQGSSAGPYLLLTRVNDGLRTPIPLGSSVVALPAPSPGDYRVTIENLAGQTVKSLRFGATDLMKNPVQLPPSSAVTSGASGTSTAIQVLLSPDPRFRK